MEAVLVECGRKRMCFCAIWSFFASIICEMSEILFCTFIYDGTQLGSGDYTVGDKDWEFRCR